MILDIWFGNKFHLIGKHGDYVIHKYGYTIDKETHIQSNVPKIVGKVYPANLHQSLMWILENSNDEPIIKEVKDYMEIYKLQHKLIHGLTDLLYAENGDIKRELKNIPVFGRVEINDKIGE